MRKSLKMILGTTFCAAALVVAGTAFVDLDYKASADETATTPFLKIGGQNLAIDGSMSLKFAVRSEGLSSTDDVDLYVWDNAASALAGDRDAKIAVITESNETAENGTYKYDVYAYSGIGFDDMLQEYYVAAYANEAGVYSEPVKYSVLTYVHNMKAKTTEENLLNVLDSVLQLGTDMQKWLGDELGPYPNDERFVKVDLAGTNTVFEDGFTTDMALAGSTVSVKPVEGYKFAEGVDEDGDGYISLDVTADGVTVEEGKVVEKAKLPVEGQAYYLGLDGRYAQSIYSTGKYLTINDKDAENPTDTAITFYFELIEGKTNEYNIKLDDGQYLNAAGSGNSLSFSEQASTAWIVDVDNERIMQADDNDYYLQINFSSPRITRYKLTSNQKDIWFEAARVLTDEEKLENAKNALDLGVTEVTGSKEITLPTVSGVDVSWAVTEGTDIATISEGTLSITNPEADTTVKVVATLTLNEATTTKEFMISVKYKDENAVPTTLTIAEALAMGATYEKGTYSEDRYYITGIVTNIANTTYGNMDIQDEDGNSIYIYGLYNSAEATDENRYDAMETKPVAGDVIKVLSVVGNYNGTPQLKAAELIEISEATAEQKLAIEKSKVSVEGIIKGGSKVELSSAGDFYTDVEITWTLKEGTDKNLATITDNVLETSNPTENTPIIVYATLSVDGISTKTEGFEISVLHTDENVTTEEVEIKMTFADYGYANAFVITDQQIQGGDNNEITVIVAKGTGSTAPAYYTSGKAIRVYGGNYLTLSCVGSITKVVFTTTNNHMTANNSSVSNGNMAHSGATTTVDDIPANTSSLVFTNTQTSGHWRVVSIVVTCEVPVV